MLRPTPGDPWGVEQHHWNTGAEENQTDIDLLEKVQKRCLALCNEPPVLESLESRRKHTDLVETYKLLHNEYRTNPQTLFDTPLRHLRGHGYKLHKGHVKTEVKRNLEQPEPRHHWSHEWYFLQE